jgi:hypothetical protein
LRGKQTLPGVCPSCTKKGNTKEKNSQLNQRAVTKTNK